MSNRLRLPSHSQISASWVAITAVALGVAAPVSGQTDDACLACHASASMMQAMAPGADGVFDSSLVVTREVYSASVHGSLGFSCATCHPGVSAPHAPVLEPVNCGICHARAQSEFEGSLHGYAAIRGNARAPTCGSCHGTHDIKRRSDPESPTHRLRIPETCAKCHGEQQLLADQYVRLPQSYSAYANSVHGTSNGNGSLSAAKCTDCHGVHELRSPSDPESKIGHRNVSATCGVCHSEVQAEYDASIHGRALQAGVTDSPSCNDCHGEHLILSSDDPAARTYGARIAVETCGRCHDDPVLNAKYGLPGGVVESYTDSYHGWAARRDDERAATCVSCHSAHLVLPEADSASTIHSSNVVETCQTCHPNADAAFAASYTHSAALLAGNKVNRAIRLIYLVVICLTIGGMVLHNFVIISYHAHLELLKLAGKRREPRPELVERFDRSQIFQHLALTISFILLVITGFALRFPDAWWVEQLTVLGMTEPVRQFLHRAAAVLMIGASIFHVHYVLLNKRGKRQIRELIPSMQDFTDLSANIRYHMRMTDKRPKFGRYDYTQKAEYWALVWGTVIMAFTGFVLWFPEEAVKVFPSMIVTASQTVHYYEAWLATLAIVVWHLFFVALHPDVYPMSWTWLTGKMPADAARKHHARWFEQENSEDKEKAD